ncbi:MAG TPA: hypothetical protein VF590_12345, partial [Isosphaeraceae bacterium]
RPGSDQGRDATMGKRRMGGLGAAMAGVVVVLGTATAEAGPMRYAVIDLGGPPETVAALPRNVDASGRAIFSTRGSDGQAHPFVSDGGRLLELPGLGGRDFAMSDGGRIVGQSTATGKLHFYRAEGGALVDEGEAAATVPGFPVGINDRGQVITYDYNATYLYNSDDGKVVTLTSSFTGQVTVRGLNNHGQAVGGAPGGPNGWMQPMLFQDGRAIDLGRPPGALGGSAAAINDAGQILVTALNEQGIGDRSFLYAGGQKIDLGHLGGYSNGGTAINHAYALNESGQIVGISTIAAGKATIGENFHPYLYDQGQLLDLNDVIPPDARWVLDWVYDINDAGQIVGEGVHDGYRRSFLLDPLGPAPPVDPAPIPEPTALVLWAAAGAGGWGVRRWRTGRPPRGRAAPARPA